jgi:predicted alpha/beta-fold hydrolase
VSTTTPDLPIITTDDFRPPSWLANPHLQSVLSSLPLRRPAVAWRCWQLRRMSQPMLVDCGGDVRLLAFSATQESLGRPQARRLVVLLHGWEGSSDAIYMQTLGQFLLHRGFDVIRLNLRDHGDSHHLNPGIFHSCRIAEVVGAVRRIQTLNPDRGVSLVGFSLGGNFFLRVAARAQGAGLELERVVAVCPVVDPERTLARLEQGWPLYRWYFVRKWRDSLRRKQEAWPELYDLRSVRALGNLTAMTDYLARTYGGFASLQDYLRGYSIVGDALASIVHSTRIIAADDDPIIAVGDLDRIARPRVLSVTRTEFGGHCGYYDARRGGTWIEREVLETLNGP